jgi:hypothetical protein
VARWHANLVDVDALLPDRKNFAAAGAGQQREPNGCLHLNCTVLRDRAYLVTDK